MSWPDVRPVLLMAVKAQERERFMAAWMATMAERWSQPLPPPPFDPPSHDGTDPWKWDRRLGT